MWHLNFSPVSLARLMISMDAFQMLFGLITYTISYVSNVLSHLRYI